MTVQIKLAADYATTADDLLRQHLLIVGATGSGKSTSAVTILSELLRQNQTAIIFDPTGEYTTLPNAVVAKLGTNAFVDYEQLTGDEFSQIFNVADALVQEKLADAVQSLKIQANVKHQKGVYTKLQRTWDEFENDASRLYHYPHPFDITLLAEQLQQEFAEPVMDLNVIGEQINQADFKAALPVVRQIKQKLVDENFKRIFNLPNQRRQTTGKMRTDVMYLMKLFSSPRSEHKTLVIDLSALADDLTLGKTLLSLLMTSLLRINQQRTVTQPVTVLIDEAHRYLTNLGERDGIFRVAREGRKAGVYLMLTTQSPLDLPTALLGQFGNFLVHRLNTVVELQAVPMLANLDQVATNQVAKRI